MKKITSLLLLFLPLITHAQWNQGGDNYTTGRLGVGTSTPAAKLHVATSNNLEGVLLNHNSQNWVYIFSPSMTTGAFNDITKAGDAGIIFGGASTPGTEAPNGFVIAPHRNSTSGIRIDGNGNIGIGTTNPDQKLTVNGVIHAEEVRVDLSVPGPDYVFEKDYDLLSLTALETYINQNKHLPEVPSAKEMEANGLNLKEMNLLLLKKVEELTLHLIALKKNNDDQQKMIHDLKHSVSILENK